MAFPGSTFGLFLDAALTQAFSGILSVVHFTNLSDNPQDFVLYLGSLGTSRELKAASNPGVDNVVIAPTDTSSIWIASTAYTVGKIVKPTANNGFIYKCTTAGTSGATQPTWPIVGIGSTVVDGTAVWALYAPHHLSTEIKLALTAGGLPAATGGAALALSPTILSGVAEAKQIHIRITNAVQTVSNNAGNAEIGINMNAAIEVGA